MNLKDARMLLGLSQQQLATKSGLHIRLIQKYEKGECSFDNMTNASRKSLENALGITIDEMEKIDLSIFSDELAKSVKQNKVTLQDVALMHKYQETRKLSQIGKFENTFKSFLERVPERLILKLSSDDLASLVDAFFRCYADGNSNK